MRQLSTFLRGEELKKLRDEVSRMAELLPPKNPWEELRFAINGCVGILYRSGKVVYHEGLSEFIESILIEDDCVEIGSDEAGKGELTGPIVVAAVALDGSRRKMLRARGLLESKSLPKARLDELASLVRSSSISYSIKVIPPEGLKEVWRKGNLNELLALWHLEVIEEVMKAADACRIIVDSFDERKLREALSRIEGPQIIVESNADMRYSSVAAASVLAKHEYVRRGASGVKWERSAR